MTFDNKEKEKIIENQTLSYRSKVNKNKKIFLKASLKKLKLLVKKYIGKINFSYLIILSL